MKTQLKWILLAAVLAVLIFPSLRLQSATITRGYTFSTNEQVTATKLHNLVDLATISTITGGDLAATTIANGNLGANCVTTDKILDGTILDADFSSKTISAASIATNAVTGVELFTNITLRAGNFDPTLTTWAANSVPASAVVGITTSAGAGDSAKIPKLSATGKIDPTFLSPVASLISTNKQGSATGTQYVWANIMSFTTTATNGTVLVSGTAMGYNVNISSMWVRIRDATTNIVSVSQVGSFGITCNPVTTATLRDTLTGSAKVYFMDVSDSTGSLTLTNTSAALGQCPAMASTNNLSISILQLQ